MTEEKLGQLMECVGMEVTRLPHGEASQEEEEHV